MDKFIHGSWEPVQAGDWAYLIGPKMGKIGANFGSKEKDPIGLRPIQNKTDENTKKKIRYDESEIKTTTKIIKIKTRHNDQIKKNGKRNSQYETQLIKIRKIIKMRHIFEMNKI